MFGSLLHEIAIYLYILSNKYKKDRAYVQVYCTKYIYTYIHYTYIQYTYIHYMINKTTIRRTFESVQYEITIYLCILLHKNKKRIELTFEYTIGNVYTLIYTI